MRETVSFILEDNPKSLVRSYWSMEFTLFLLFVWASQNLLDLTK